MKMPIALALSWTLATALPLAASAVEYRQVQADKSEITFVYQQMGVNMNGRFRQFSAQLRFDPADSASAQATVDVNLGSIDTGSSEADSEVQGKDWLNIAVFPSARFTSSGIKALGGDRYELAGQLSIKGQSRAISVPLTVVAQGNQAVFEGTFNFKRADFAIGEGVWADVGTVANEIQVKFRVLASGT